MAWDAVRCSTLWSRFQVAVVAIVGNDVGFVAFARLSSSQPGSSWNHLGVILGYLATLWGANLTHLGANQEPF